MITINVWFMFILLFILALCSIVIYMLSIKLMAANDKLVQSGMLGMIDKIGNNAQNKLSRKELEELE